MSSPAFGGKMTSTSGKTRQNDHVIRGVTSNLQASSSRDNNNVMAVDAVASDGSVSPFEAAEASAGGDRVGGAPDWSHAFKGVDGNNQIEHSEESIPLIVFTPIESHMKILTNDGKKQSNNSNTKNNSSRNKSMSNSRNNNNNNNKINNSRNRNSTSNGNNTKNNTNNDNGTNTRTTSANTKSPRSARPIGRPVSNTALPGTRATNVKRVGSAVRRHETTKNNNGTGSGSPERTTETNNRTDLITKEVLLDGDSKVGAEVIRLSGEGKDVVDASKSKDKQKNFLQDMRRVCDKCGVSLNTDNIMRHICNDNGNDDDNNDDNDSGEDEGENAVKKRSKFCCFLCHNKVRDKHQRTKSESKDKRVPLRPAIQSSINRNTSSAGRVSVKSKVTFSEPEAEAFDIERDKEVKESSDNNEENRVDNAKSKVESDKLIVNSGESDINDSLTTRRDLKVKRKKKDSSVHPYSKVLNMIVFVPNMHLIPDGRKYENYYTVKPRDDHEIGKKPKWIKPRLKHYAQQMGCGTSNQVVSQEGKMPIVVFGATGVIGGSVVRALLRDPRFVVKAVTRTPTTDQARVLAEIGAVVVPADLNDVRSLQRVMGGAAGVFLTTNFWEHLSKQKELNHGMNAIDAAVSCNVHHFIFQGSEHTREQDKPCGHLNAKAAIEEYVKETSLAFTSIHLPFLYENLLSLFKPHCVEGSTYTIPIPMGDQSMDCMALHDFARCVVNIFLRPKNHMLKSVQLTGDRMSVQHMADVLNRHFDDRKFVYHKLNPGDFATFDFQGSQDLAAMFEYMQTASHRDPRITRRIHHSVVCFDKWVSDNKQKLVDAMKDTG